MSASPTFEFCCIVPAIGCFVASSTSRQRVNVALLEIREIIVLSCKDVADNASDLMEGKISFWQRMSMRLHLSICTHCRRYVSQLKLTIGLAGLSAEMPPEPADEQIDQLIAKLRQEP